jgi:adenine-specific DNA-methyltransferase
LAVRKCSKPTFAYTENEAYVMMSFNVIRSNRIDLKYLSAILNSKLVAFWLKHKGKMQGHIFQVDKEPILSIPVFDTPNDAIKEQIIKLVNQILQLNNDLQTTTLPNQIAQIQRRIEHSEDRINEIVYELYGLSNDEIEMIEK